MKIEVSARGRARAARRGTRCMMQDEARLAALDAPAAEWVAGLPLAMQPEGAVPVPVRVLAGWFADALDVPADDVACAAVLAALVEAGRGSRAIVFDGAGALPVEALLALPIAAPSPGFAYRVTRDDGSVLVAEKGVLRRLVVVDVPDMFGLVGGAR